MENWQSEYLQFALLALATVWLLQRGSPESKELDKAGTESEAEQRIGRHADESSPRWAAAGGIRAALFSNSGRARFGRGQFLPVADQTAMTNLSEKPTALVVTDMLSTYEHDDAQRLAISAARAVPRLAKLIISCRSHGVSVVSSTTTTATG